MGVVDIDGFIVKREARKIQKSLENLDPKTSETGDFITWQRNAEDYLKEVCKSNQDYVNKLKKMERVLKQKLVITDSGPSVEQEIKAKSDYKNSAKELWDDFIKGLKSQGLPFGYKDPRRRENINIILKFVLTIMGGIIVAYYMSWLNQSEYKEHLLNDPARQQWKVTEKAFYHWYRKLFWEYRRLSDSVVQYNGSKFPYQPGMIDSKLLEWRNSYFEKNETTLDSFLAEYSIQGGDTTNLHYQHWPLGKITHKLPMRR